MMFALRFLPVLFCLFLILGVPSTAAKAQTYVLQAHPVFTAEQSAAVFQPLADYLSESTGYRFELQTPRDFHRHWLDIRRGGLPDLVVEDAHLIALRMNRYGYEPLVRAEQPATFSLMTTLPGTDLKLADFIARPVTTLPAPSLGHLVLASWYPNPMQQPRIQSTARSWLDAVESVFSMEADAAIVPHNLVSRYVNMTEVVVSTEFPHLSVAASPRLDKEVREAVRRALLELHEDPDQFGVLHELDIERFVIASGDEYLGLENWLDWVYSDF